MHIQLLTYNPSPTDMPLVGGKIWRSETETVISAGIRGWLGFCLVIHH